MREKVVKLRIEDYAIAIIKENSKFFFKKFKVD